MKLYCDSCEEACCADCINTGPHQGPTHLIIPLAEAYQSKLASLQEMLNSSLVHKRDALMQQMRVVEGRLGEVKAASSAIERETKRDVEGILDRLKGQESVKSAALRRELDDLRRDVDQITMITRNIVERRSMNAMEFLSRYREMYDTCSRLNSKAIRALPDVRTDDFERESYKRHLMLQAYEKMTEVLAVKDQMIWNLLKEKNSLLEGQAEAEKETETETADSISVAEAAITTTRLPEPLVAHAELEQWVRLSDSLAGELRQWQQVCYFCNLGMSPAAVNCACPANQNHAASESGPGGPPLSHIGTGRHYFVPAK